MSSRSLSPRAARRAALLVLCVVLPSGANAGDVDVRAELEGRWFPHAQSPEAGVSAALGAMWSRELDDDGLHILRVEGFGRVDGHDTQRTHADLRQAYWEYVGDPWMLSAGYRRVFWGYAESRHLVDVINQSDFVEDLEAEQKLGQPVLSAGWLGERSAIEAFVMPRFRERTFPGRRGHPRVPVPIDEHASRFESDRKKDHADVALRYRIGFDHTDVGISYFQGTAREPDLKLCFEPGSSFNQAQSGADCTRSDALFAGRTPSQGALVTLLQQLGLAPDDAAIRRAVIDDLIVIPHYDQLRQVSIDAMSVRGAWAFKLEALARRLRDDDSVAAVAGVEYTIGKLFGSRAALGLVAERLHDERDDILVARFDDEWFAGLRLLMPGRSAVNALLGLLTNEDGKDRLLQLEFGFDPAHDWRVLGKLRAFDKVPGDDLDGFLRDEDMLSLTVVHHF